MNRSLLKYILFFSVWLTFGCNIFFNKQQRFDSNYSSYKDSTQSYIVEEISLFKPVLIKSINYGPWLITEEENLLNVVKDKDYYYRDDVYLFGDNFAFYGNIFTKSARTKIEHRFFLDSLKSNEAEIKLIYNNFYGFKVFKFECDTIKNSRIKFLLGFISINRYNRTNNHENAFQFKSRYYNTEFRKILYPFCLKVN